MQMADNDEHPGVKKVKQMWERGEFEKIDRMVKFWDALEGFGRLGDMLRRLVIWAGIILAAYFAVTEGIMAFIRRTAG